jgi:hypothetical protein
MKVLINDEVCEITVKIKHEESNYINDLNKLTGDNEVK